MESLTRKDKRPLEWITILDELHHLEEANDVRVVFAVESGSRMWGFESDDSDYDVRFVYVARDLTRYTSFDRIGKPYPDTLQYISEDRKYDYSGWDLPKFLRHLLELNLSLVEWCTSPIVYKNEGIRDVLIHYVRRNSAWQRLVPAYRGFMLSSKACGLENVKRAIYVARAYLALRALLETRRMPDNFTWGVLLEASGLPDGEKEMLRTLRDKKMCNGEQHPDLPAEIRSYLEDKMAVVRNMDVPDIRPVCVTQKERGLLDYVWLKSVRGYNGPAPSLV